MTTLRLRTSLLALPLLAMLVPISRHLRAQDLGSLAVFVGNPNKDNPAAEASFQSRTEGARNALGEGQTFIAGFVNYRNPMSMWPGDANWWRQSVVQSEAVKHMVPVYSVGLADAVTPDPVAQMHAVGDPQDTVYGPIFQRIINGFRNSGFHTIYLRIGWEHNGEWYPWAITEPYKTFNPARNAAFLAAWRRVADIAHNTPGINVVTVWSPNFERLTPQEVALTYPGDEYVDVIAPDIYSPVWNAIPENWDPELGGTSPEFEWKANTVNRQHVWDYPDGTPENPTAGYGLVAMMDFALAHNKPFGLGETGTDGGMSGGSYRGPEDRGDFPLYLAKRISEKMAEGLRIACFGLWNSKAYRFTGGQRPIDTGSWVTFVNILAGADPVQAEAITNVIATDAVRNEADPGATGNYEPDPTRRYIRDEDIGGEVSTFTPNAVGDFVEYVVPVADPGAHTVKLRVKKGPNRGRYRLTIDGVNQGDVGDFYSLNEHYVIVDFGKKNIPVAGNKRFRLTVVGRHAQSTDYVLGVDYFDLTPDRREAETLLHGELTDGTALFHEAAANNGAGERFDADAVGDYIEYLVPIIDPGTYSVKVRVKKHNGRGRFQLTIGGAPQGGEQDLYSPTGEYVVLDLGTKTFKRVGNKVFRFTVTGRHPDSIRYRLGFDYISMTRR